MKYIKHIILTVMAMVMMGAWAQTAPEKQTDGTWQFTMPDANQLLQVEYYPTYTLTLATVGNGSVELIGDGLGISQLSIPSSWHNDESALTVADMPGFEPTTLQQAQAMSGIPSTGRVAIIYNIVNTAAYVAIFENGHVFTQMPNSITSLTHEGCYHGKTANNIQFYYVASVLPDGVTVKNEDNGEYYVAPGTEVIVKATPAENYNFTSWDPTRENPVDTMHITVTKDTTVTATFTAYPTLKLVAEGNGSIKLGGVFQLAIPSSWEDDNTTLLTAADMPGFAPITSEELEAMTDIPATGNVMLVYDIDDQGTPYFAQFQGGSLVHVSSNNVSHKICYDIVKEIGAQFYYTTSDLSEYVTVKNADNGEYYVTPGAEVNIQAVPAESHHLSSWSDVEGTVLTRSITVTKDSVITATFTVNPTLTLVADGNGTVILDGYIPAEPETVLLAEFTGSASSVNQEGKVYMLVRSNNGTTSYDSNHGLIPSYNSTELSITIAAGIGYAIDSVTFELKTPSDAMRKLTQAPYVFWVTKDEYNNGYSTYSAAGRQGIYYGQQGPTNVKIWGHATSTLPAGVTEYTVNDEVVDGKFYVAPGTEVSVTATPNANSQFLKWEDNSTDLTRTVTVTCDTTFTATFESSTAGLTPEGELTVTGDKFVDEHGQIVGAPRITETGELIDNSALPVHLIGQFSVSSTKKVYFSPANLRYTRTSTSVDWSTGTWSFMPHQYSIVETAANPYCTENYGDKTAVGLFGWGTWGEGKTPNITSTSNANYTWSTDFQGTLGGYSDWRTLTKDEWTYLLTTRATGVTVNSTNNARYTLATINTGTSMVKGMIIFPDGFTGNNTDGVTWGTINAASNYTTTCTTAGWNALESANCLFLPATGWRAKNMDNGDGSRVEGINTWSYYWTKDSYSTSDGYMLGFDGQNVKPSDHAEHRFGFSVRLVRNAE